LCLAFGLVTASIAIPKATHAEDETARKPADGSWVRYQVEQKLNDERKIDVTITASLVGTVIEEGLTYRWLEYKTVTRKAPDTEETYVNKILVPEEDLFESSKPFERVRRMWGWNSRLSKEPGLVPSRILKSKSYPWDFMEERLLWTPGMLKAARPLEGEPKIVEYQRGQLKCTRAYSGELTHELPAPAKTPDLKIINKRKYTLWLHPDVPFGFTEARIEIERITTRTQPAGATLFRLQDFGSDAKSALPDSN